MYVVCVFHFVCACSCKSEWMSVCVSKWMPSVCLFEVCIMYMYMCMCASEWMNVFLCVPYSGKVRDLTHTRAELSWAELTCELVPLARHAKQCGLVGVHLLPPLAGHGLDVGGVKVLQHVNRVLKQVVLFAGWLDNLGQRTGQQNQLVQLQYFSKNRSAEPVTIAPRTSYVSKLTHKSTCTCMYMHMYYM